MERRWRREEEEAGEELDDFKDRRKGVCIVNSAWAEDRKPRRGTDGSSVFHTLIFCSKNHVIRGSK